MKKLNYFLLIALIITSCKKEDNGILYPPGQRTDVPILTVEKTDVKTFEVISLTVLDEVTSDKYQVSFGEEKIELVKSSDSSLVFFVPDVPAGSYELISDFGRTIFNVTATQITSAESVIEVLLQNFDNQISDFNPSTPEEEQEINSIIQYKDEALAFFNDLSTEEKRKTALFIEANKEPFVTFVNNLYTQLDAATVRNKQSECPTTDNLAFYNCTSENLGDSFNDFIKALKKMKDFFILAGIAIGISPTPAGLGVASFSIGGAMFFLWADIAPASKKLYNDSKPFFQKPWILGVEFYKDVIGNIQFSTNVSFNLDTDAFFRTISLEDIDISQELDYFINSWLNLKPNWEEFEVLIGIPPTFEENLEVINLDDEDIEAYGITNPNVQLVEYSANSIEFTTTSTEDEDFSFTIKTVKEGFEIEQEISATITNFICPSYTVSGSNCTYPNLQDFMNGEYLLTGTQNGRPSYTNLAGTVKIDYGLVGSPATQKWRLVAFGLTTSGGTPIGTVYFNEMDSNEVPINGWEIIELFENAPYSCTPNIALECN